MQTDGETLAYLGAGHFDLGPWLLHLLFRLLLNFLAGFLYAALW
jgi:hypothetical protein